MATSSPYPTFGAVPFSRQLAECLPYFALPQAHAWQDRDDPIRLREQQWQNDPKALACYGVPWQTGTP